MIREIVFAPEAWVLWYGTTAAVYTTYMVRKPRETVSVPVYTPDPEPQDETPAPEHLIAATVDEDDVHVVTTVRKPTKPDWMS